MSNRVPLRWGVLGATGFVAGPYRDEIRQAPQDSQIVALCARRRDRLQAAAKQDGAAFISDDWRQVVQHPDVNCVLVATPDCFHYEAVMASAHSGKQVFCEKPVALDSQQAYEMWEACHKAGVAHFVPFWTRYVPVFARARELVASGILGDVRVVVYRWHNPRPPEMPFTWRDDADVSAGGTIADVGSHAYDTLRWILDDEARRVLAHTDVITDAKLDVGEINLREALDWGDPRDNAPAKPAARKRGTAPDYGQLAIEFQRGTVGIMVLSHAPVIRKGLAPELELHGTAASLAVHRLGSRLELAVGQQPPVVHEVLEDPGFGNRFAQHVIPALNAGPTTKPEQGQYPSLWDGWRVQVFTDAAARSARQGGWAHLADGNPGLNRLN